MPQGPNPEANAIFDHPYNRADGQLKVSQPHGGWCRILHHGRTERAMANSEVILCAGAFNSPRIPHAVRHWAGTRAGQARDPRQPGLSGCRRKSTRPPRTGMSAPFEDGHSSGNRLQFHCLANHLQQARSIIFFTKRVNGPISRFLSQFYTKLRVVI